MSLPSRICLFLLMINHLQMNVRCQEISCGWIQPVDEITAGDPGSCFDIEEIIKNCIPVYVRINLHFFVADDCYGGIQQINESQKDVYRIAEEVISFANQTFEKNQAQWQVPGAEAPCIPIRLVLKGIYVHCKSHAIGMTNTVELNNEFGVNKGTEINFYIAGNDIRGTGIGIHSERCGSATDFSKKRWWTIGNLVHELGHIFTLLHSFDNDGCDDTPIITHQWDKNCDGIIQFSADKKLNEGNLKCWNLIEPGKIPGEEGYSDMNDNMIHDCDEKPPCTSSPCCYQENLDNNIMSYSANIAAVTNCQLKKMLTDLSGFNCSLIEKIGDCPPVSAFITQLPQDKSDQSQCRECLILEASFNEEQYQLKIFEQLHDGLYLAYDGPWKKGQATIFCYHTGIAFKGLANYLKPDTKYLARLITRNTCSEDSYSFEFTTNTAGCGTVRYETLKLSPNPGTEQLTLEIQEADEEIDFPLFAKNILTGRLHTFEESQILPRGNKALDINISTLASGTYSLLAISKDAIYLSNFIKI